jgi:hypothetical protein
MIIKVDRKNAGLLYMLLSMALLNPESYKNLSAEGKDNLMDVCKKVMKQLS